MGYGFHEDGLKAGLNAARQLLADAGTRRERPAPPWHRGRTRSGGRMNPPGPLIGFGEVRHRRLRPVGNAFSYPTYFLMLPMRQLRAQAAKPWRSTAPAC